MNRSDLKGKKFGKLTVLDYCRVDKYGQTEWLCECECGNKTIVKAYNLKSGRTTSCGCRKHERFSDDLIGKQFTGNDWEWDINVYGNDQNKRCPKVFRRKDGTAYNINGRAFSDNGGKTWFTNKESFKDISFPCKSEDLKTEYIILDTEE